MQVSASARPLNILDYWRIIWSAKRVIVVLVLSSVVLTGIVSKMSPKLYEAKTTLLPVKEEPLGGGGFSFGGGKGKEGSSGGGSLALEALGGKSSGPSLMDILYIILTSRRMAEAVISQLDLIRYYGTKSMATTVNALRGEVAVKLTPSKSYEITVLSRDPQMAADIANAYVANLDRLNKELNMTATKRTRIFIEGRLAEKAKKLADAEEELKKFQNENRVRVQSEDTAEKGDIEVAASLHAKITELEVELAALREFALPSHPMINQLEAQIQELRKQLDRLEEEQVRGLGKRLRVPLSKKLYPAFEEATAFKFMLLRLMRQVKVEEAVYGMLIGMLEQAKISEARDMPTIQAIDPAIPPEIKSRPNTLQNVITAGAISLALGILLALFLNYLERLKTEEAVSVPRVEDTEAASEVDGNGDKLPSYPVLPKDTERLHG